nr:hypothetical protein BV87_19750 [Sphingobium yanoikuyae]
MVKVRGAHRAGATTALQGSLPSPPSPLRVSAFGDDRLRRMMVAARFARRRFLFASPGVAGVGGAPG